MKRYLKIVILVVTGSILFQLIFYHFVGKRAIHIACMKNLKTLAYDVDSVVVYSSYVTLTETEQNKIRNALGFKVVAFTADPKTFSERFRHNQRAYGMGYEINEVNWMTADITEYNGALGYGEVWKAKYVWMFFCWIQIKQENVGQS
jgi:hypothetical protein